MNNKNNEKESKDSSKGKSIEKEVRDILNGKIKGSDKYEVVSKRSFYYKIFVDDKGQIKPDTAKRGDYSFQADVAIIRKDIKNVNGGNEVPLVILEVKENKKEPTTHDIMVYSSKAIRHKEIYPYLRYGLLSINNKGTIPPRFLTHNVGFDFAIALKNLDTENDEIYDLIKIMEMQLKVAEKLRETLDKGNNFKIYCTTVNFEDCYCKDFWMKGNGKR